MTDDEGVYLLGEDILDPYGGAFRVTKGLSTAFSARVITTPVSEASITGLATGMAMRGLRPILEIMFGDFLTLCSDQIINSACKFSWMYNNQVTVPLVIRTAMGGRRGYGPTHSQTLEALFLNVPGLTMVAPSHFHDPGQLLRAAVLNIDTPVLFIEGKLLYPQRLQLPDGKNRVGHFFAKNLVNHSRDFPTVLLSLAEDGPPDVTLIVYGTMATLAAEAAFNLFMQEEIVVEIVIPSLIKPLPLSDILPSVRNSTRTVIAEEGVRYSGWGAELASRIQESTFDILTKPIARIGAWETPIPSSRPLEDQVLAQVEDIEEAIREIAR
jgi:pyruvate/2-oxoglutarate/acetoin dehydrogenase E1 component